METKRAGNIAVREDNLYLLRLKKMMKGSQTENSTEGKEKVELNTTEIGSLQAMHEALGHIKEEKVLRIEFAAGLVD